MGLGGEEGVGGVRVKELQDLADGLECTWWDGQQLSLPGQGRSSSGP